jgi:hypothetical protein
MTTTKVNNILELMTQAEKQYELVKNLHHMFTNTQDFDLEDLFLVQLAVYAGIMRQVKAVAPQLFAVKLNELLEDVVKLEAELNKPNRVLTPEMVAQVELLLDTGVALGWVEPQPEAPIYTCELCGYKGRLNKDIVERPYYDVILHRDNTRYECENIQACLTRIGR